jgi:hypothetical protein
MPLADGAEVIGVDTSDGFWPALVRGLWTAGPRSCPRRAVAADARLLRRCGGAPASGDVEIWAKPDSDSHCR